MKNVRRRRPKGGDDDVTVNEIVIDMKRNLCVKLCTCNLLAVRTIIIVLLSFIASDMMAQTYTGKASYYANDFHGRKSASGKVYDMYKYTCAHKTLPFGTKLKVTNLKNGKTTIVEVTDRGPYAKGRIVDLSKAAAMDLDMISSGVAKVEVEVIKNEPEHNRAQLILSEPELIQEYKLTVQKRDVSTEWAKTIR